MNKQGRPVLVGTTSVEQSEELAEQLREEGEGVLLPPIRLLARNAAYFPGGCLTLRVGTSRRISFVAASGRGSVRRVVSLALRGNLLKSRS